MRLNIPKVVSAVSLAVALGGCSSLRVHDPSLKAALDEARLGFTAARVQHLGLIGEQRRQLGAMTRTEKEALVDRVLLERDDVVLRLLEEQDWQRALAREIEARAVELLGCPAGTDCRGLLDGDPGPVNDPPLLIQPAAAEVRRLRLQVLDHVERFELAGGRASIYCLGPSDTPEASPLLAPGDLTAGLYETIRIDCVRLRRAEGELARRQELTRSPSVGRVVLPIAADRVHGNGRLTAVAERLDAIERLVEAEERVAAAVRSVLVGMEAAYACALATALPAAELETRLAATARMIRDTARLLDAIELHGWMLPLPSPTPWAGAGDPPAADPSSGLDANLTGDCAAISAPPPSSPQALLARAGLEPSDIVSLFALLNDLQPAKPLAAAIRRARAAHLDSSLAEIARTLAEPPADGAGQRPSLRARIVLDMVRGFGLLSQWATINDGRLPDPSTLAIDLALIQAQAKEAAIEFDRLQRERSLTVVAFEATLAEIRFLNQAEAARRGDERSAAIRRFTEAWNQGRLPQLMVPYTILKDREDARLAREEAVTGSLYGLLDPALAELGTYSTGGMPPEIIARSLSIVGLGAVLFGGTAP